MLPMNGMGAPTGGQAPSLQSQIKSCWTGIPLFCRFILITTTLLMLVSFFVPSIFVVLACIPA